MREYVKNVDDIGFFAICYKLAIVYSEIGLICR